MFIMMAQQQSVPLVEEWNMLTTIRTIGRRAESVVGCKPVFFLLMDAAVLACSFQRPSVVVKCNQLYSDMRMYCKTVEHRPRKSRDLLQTREITSCDDKVTHFCFCRNSFQCSCMRTVARLFLRVSSISAHGSRRDHSYFGRCV